jgi:hypothetical protein
LGELPTGLKNDFEAPYDDILLEALEDDPNSIKIVKLSDLERIYKMKNRGSAIFDIVNPKRLFIDDEYIVSRTLQQGVHKKHVSLRMEDPQIDQATYVARYCGLGAIIPTKDGDDSWSFKMSLANQDAAFSTKHTNLGFDVDENGIKLGVCNGETIWIFMVPDDYINSVCSAVPPGTSSGPPHMSKIRYRKFLLFLAKCLEQLHLYGIYCRDPYVDASMEERFKGVTNIL